jgi:hypothetical protein
MFSYRPLPAGESLHAFRLANVATPLKQIVNNGIRSCCVPRKRNVGPPWTFFMANGIVGREEEPPA